MICKTCGYPVPDGVSRCANCGGEDLAEEKLSLRDLLTAENLEMLAAVIGAVPVALMAASGIMGIFCEIKFIGLFFRIIRALIQILVTLCAAGTAGYVGYLMYREREMTKPGGIAAMAAAVFALLSCIGILADVGFLKALCVLSLICTLEMIPRVIINKKGLGGNIDLAADIAVYQSYFKAARQAQTDEQLRQANMAQRSDTSYFDGKGFECLGYTLAASILSCVTFGIAFPWMWCRLRRWMYSHTVINGRRLTFTGTGGQLIGLWIKWSLLTIVTFGIYSLFIYVDMYKWETKHLFFEDEHPVNGQVNTGSVFDGNTLQFVGTELLCGLLIVFTLGIGTPWAVAMMEKWKMRHTVISGLRLDFDGTGLQFLWQCIVIFCLTLVTFGIYSSWGIVRMNKWVFGHTFAAAGRSYD